ncbi:MAG: RIP metalloprotease RseP [Planctomycetota bacterium]|nr:MAG: RIP metalloprotease RseP [Planctomycetota bacterium]
MSLIYILLVVFGIGILIFVHELGHFLLAKKCGVRVEVFAIGFGTRLFGWRRNKEGKVVFSIGPLRSIEPGTEDHTDYRVCLVPLGGYVKMAGEEPTEDLTGAEWEFPSKTVGQRAAIIVAGVVFNAIFALFAFIIAFQWGVRFTYNEVGNIEVGKPAWKAGLDSGDQVLEIDGSKINDFDDLATTIAFSSAEKGSIFKIRRGNRILEVPVKSHYEPRLGFQTIGIGVRLGLSVKNILTLPDGQAPAKLAGLQPNDEILGIDSFPVENHLRLYRLLASFPSKQLSFQDQKSKKEILLSLGEWEQNPNIQPENLVFNGLSFQNWGEFRRTISFHGELELPLKIRRNGKVLTLKITPGLSPFWIMGIQNGAPLTIEAIRKGSLGSKYFQVGDTIQKVNGKEVPTLVEFLEALEKAEGKEVQIEFLRGKKVEQVSISMKEIKTYWLITQIYWKKGLEIEWPRSSISFPYFQKGDRILAVNGEKVESLSELVDGVARRKMNLFFLIERKGKKIPTPHIQEKQLKSHWVLDSLSFSDQPVVGNLLPLFPAQKAGIQKGDRILAINGTPIDSWSDLVIFLQNSKGKEMEIRLERKKKEYTFRLTPFQSGVKVQNAFSIFKKDDLILKLGNKFVDSFVEIWQEIKTHPNTNLEITYIRNNKIHKKSLDPAEFLSQERRWITKVEWRKDAKIGVYPHVARHLVQVPSLSRSIVLGIKKSYIFVKRILLTLKSVLTAKVSAKNLGGPVLIAQASYSLAKQGFGTLLYFLGILSLNLAIINILPIPILDGGHLFFLAIEKIKGSKVSEETMMIANYIGLALLLFLMIFVTYNDIMRLFR